MKKAVPGPTIPERPVDPDLIQQTEQPATPAAEPVAPTEKIDKRDLSPEDIAYISHLLTDDQSPKKLIFVGDFGKKIPKAMASFSYTFLNKPDSFKAFRWLEKMADAHSWSRQMGIPGKELPDGIVCKLELPDGNAYSLYEKIKWNYFLRLLPFVVITQKLSKEAIQTARDAGIDDLFAESVHPAILHNRLTFLKKFKLERAKDEGHFIPPNEVKISFLKRFSDITVSFLALTILSPLLVLVAILIKLESKGPIFYVSKRAGIGYKVFDFYKFRTMRHKSDKELQKLIHLNQYKKAEQEEAKIPCVNCPRLKNDSHPVIEVEGKKVCVDICPRKGKNEAKPSFVKLDNDPRITPLGRFLRNTSIDELPQFINVLKGDMSLVGNRPLPLYEAEQLTTDDWAKRFLAPAGITGLWQVLRRGKKEMSEEERKRLDNVYAEDASFITDLRLIIKTIPALFQRRNV